MANHPAQRENSAPESGGSRHSQRARLPLGLYKRAITVFLAALVVFIVAVPFVGTLPSAQLLEGILLTLVLTCGVLAVGGRRHAFLLAIGLGVPALATKWLNHIWPDTVAHGIHLALGALLLVTVAFYLLRFILRAPRVDMEVLSAAVATYLVLALVWMMLYLLSASLIPNAFVIGGSASGKTLDGFTALYFSFITLCTVGYGDISPAAPVVRMLAMVEGITGVLYMSVLIARLVTLYTSDRE